MLPYRDNILLCVMALAGRVPKRIYTAGSAVVHVVGSDNICFNSFFLYWDSSTFNDFPVNMTFSMPYKHTGKTYVCISAMEVSGSRPFSP